MTNPHTPTKAGEAASEHRALSREEAAEVDAASGLVELPPIRLSSAMLAVLAGYADQNGLVIQAQVRAILDQWFDPSRLVAPSPADRAASAQQAESPGYQRGYDDAIAACAALGWKTTAATPQALPTPQAERSDTERLDWMQKRRVSLIPEFEGPWDATVYDDDGEPNFSTCGNTPRAAIDAAMCTTAAATSEGEKS